jgi:type I restriction enzyme S subunit
MSKEKLIPELRFPEFKNEGEWEENTLSDVCEITNGKANAQDHVEEGIYPLFDRSEVIKASNEFIFDCEAVIIPGEGMRFIPKYYEGKFNLHQRAYVLKDFNCSGQFVFYSMLHRSVLLSQKAVQSTVLSLRLPILQNFPIEVPHNPKEQQKIALCLSSLDEVIAAHSQRLELLKDHKKGLMQNLFPQDGETVPKLRFKEFEKDGEWEEMKISDIGVTINGLTGKNGEDFGTGKSYVTYKQVFDNSIIDYQKCGKVEIDENENQNTLQKGDILFTTSSETPNEVGFASVLVDTPTENIYLNSFCFALRPFQLENTQPQFSRYIFHSPIYRKSVTAIAQGSTRYNLSKVAFLNLKIPIPNPKEQQKIASCLSSLDALITAQAEKIEQLKQHKKGLMQGLFPKMNE